jgi:hypothetical protein
VDFSLSANLPAMDVFLVELMSIETMEKRKEATE